MIYRRLKGMVLAAAIAAMTLQPMAVFADDAPAQEETQQSASDTDMSVSDSSSEAAQTASDQTTTAEEVQQAESDSEDEEESETDDQKEADTEEDSDEKDEEKKDVPDADEIPDEAENGEEDEPMDPVWHPEWQNRFDEFKLSTKYELIPVVYRITSIKTTYLQNCKSFNKESITIAKISKDAVVRLIDEQSDWSFIETKTEDGKILRGYVRTRILKETDLTEDTPKKVHLKEESDTCSADFTKTTYEELSDTVIGYDKRQELVNYGLQFLGNPYIWSCSSLTDGTDCSGFTMGVYAHFGISLPRCSSEQVNAGIQIAVTDAKPGDLIFYSNAEKGVYHVMICYSNDGNGNIQVLHASSHDVGIIISNLNMDNACCAVSLESFLGDLTQITPAAEETNWVEQTTQTEAVG